MKKAMEKFMSSMVVHVTGTCMVLYYTYLYMFLKQQSHLNLYVLLIETSQLLF
jgi:hypothetical protein